jgi:hypothetical protein
MSDDRWGPLIIGALAVIAGAALFLSAGDVIPLPDKTFGSPRWVVAVFALSLFFGGCYAVSLVLPTPRMQQVLGGAAGLALVSSGALLFTWLALTGGGARHAPALVRPGSLVVGPDVARFVVHAFFWLFAIPIDAIALMAWFIALRSLVRRPPP